jgi:hypothetical protein
MQHRLRCNNAARACERSMLALQYNLVSSAWQSFVTVLCAGPASRRCWSGQSFGPPNPQVQQRRQRDKHCARNDAGLQRFSRTQHASRGFQTAALLGSFLTLRFSALRELQSASQEMETLEHPFHGLDPIAQRRDANEIEQDRRSQVGSVETRN